jgi:hypothetical protein
MRLQTVIEESFKELAKKYGADPRGFLTETDVVSFLLCDLRKRLENQRLAVHSQLRPFWKDDGRYKVIKTRGWRWDSQDKANDGAVFDLVIVDDDDKYFRQAVEKAKEDQRCSNDLKYWRILSYPVQSFRAAIEVKIRLWQNIRFIERNGFPKLCAIRKKNKDCLLYYLVCDQEARDEDISKLQEISKKYTQVRVKIVRPRK